LTALFISVKTVRALGQFQFFFDGKFFLKSKTYNTKLLESNSNSLAPDKLLVIAIFRFFKDIASRVRLSNVKKMKGVIFLPHHI